MTTINGSVREAALELVEANAGTEPTLQRVYWFPAEDEIRLIYVDALTGALRKGESIAPFYFGANRAANLPYASAVALILPEEEGKAAPPKGWGEWSRAEVIWEKIYAGIVRD